MGWYSNHLGHTGQGKKILLRNVFNNCTFLNGCKMFKVFIYMCEQSFLEWGQQVFGSSLLKSNEIVSIAIWSKYDRKDEIRKWNSSILTFLKDCLEVSYKSVLNIVIGLLPRKQMLWRGGVRGRIGRGDCIVISLKSEPTPPLPSSSGVVKGPQSCSLLGQYGWALDWSLPWLVIKYGLPRDKCSLGPGEAIPGGAGTWNYLIPAWISLVHEEGWEGTFPARHKCYIWNSVFYFYFQILLHKENVMNIFQHIYTEASKSPAVYSVCCTNNHFLGVLAMLSQHCAQWRFRRKGLMHLNFHSFHARRRQIWLEMHTFDPWEKWILKDSCCLFWRYFDT